MASFAFLLKLRLFGLGWWALAPLRGLADLVNYGNIILKLGVVDSPLFVGLELANSLRVQFQLRAKVFDQ